MRVVSALAAAAGLGCAPLIAAAFNGSGGQAKAANPQVIRFNRDILPIFTENCFKCHGPDKGTRVANLRLDVEEGAKADRGGYAPVVPGHPERSAILARVTSKDPAKVMPPARIGKPLTAREIGLLRNWIAQGAKWEGHWSYLPVMRPNPPEVQNKVWPRNAIDRFILARLETKGIKPSPDADRRTLIRRISLDLRGLPPSPEDTHAFLADHRPDAYERLVDRYLASPHCGERMAQFWLDIVRYADTVGYHGDQDVTVWPYRDYVINAFNANEPFDVFTRQQLAGDLLPSHGLEQLVASCYNRLGMMSAEGGVQDKEYRAKYAADRVRNLSTVWLASTMQCCECHDHKYDPFSTKDFYRCEALFADIKEQGFYAGGGANDWGPKIRLPSDAQKRQLAQLESGIAAAKKALDEVKNDSLAASRAKWEESIRALDAAKAIGWISVKPESADSSGGSTMQVEGDGTVFVSGRLPAFDTYTVTVPASKDPITAIRLEVLPDERLPGDGVSRAGYYFVLSEFTAALRHGGGMEQPIKLDSVAVSSADEGTPGLAAIDGRPDTGWAQKYPGGGYHVAVFRLAEPLHPGSDGHLVIRIRHSTRPRLAIGKFRIGLTSVQDPDTSGQGIPDNVLVDLRKPADKRSAAEAEAIAGYYRSVAPELREQRDRLAKLEADHSLLLGAIPTTLITEATDPRTIRVLPRGNWMDDSGEIVQPGVPHFLTQIQKNGRANRLDLADWIVSPDNPLTGRVFVNRLWKLFFGMGIAKNLDDFGVQGEQPVDPELLDWLAVEFQKGSVGSIGGVGSGGVTPRTPHTSHTAAPWDVKHLVRLIVTSRAYRQSSVTTAELAARDPFNRLFARQSVFRLDAENVRDVALAAAGMLSQKVGGPSVKPYEPKGYLAPLNFPRREWAADVGEDQYRRGLYTDWQRTFLQPALLAFDAPSREEAICTRTVSNTPMQALVLMDDPTFVEASRVFAEHAIRQGGANFDLRLVWVFEQALSRTPGPREVAILRRLYSTERARFAADLKAAEQAITLGDWPVAKDLDPVEVAAWSMVTRAVLNLHETITRS